MNHPDFDPSVGWTKYKNTSWGVLPTYCDFSGRFYITCENSNQLFRFRNDEQVGNSKLTCEELWDTIWDVWYSPERSEKDEVWVSDILNRFGYKWDLGLLILTGLISVNPKHLKNVFLCGRKIMSLGINFKEYAVRNADGTINEAETLAKIAKELRNYIENLEHSPAKIQAMIDAMIFDHRGEHITGDFVASEIARALSAGKSANYSPIKRQVLGIISDLTKSEKNNNPNPRYKSGRGRSNTGLQLLPELYQAMEIKQVLSAAAAELDSQIFD